MKRAWIAMTLLLLACAACGETSATAGTPAPGAGSSVAADASAPAEAATATAATPSINARCPMMGKAVEPDGGTTQYAGHTVGFCCSKCVGKFNALDDAGKVAALAKAGTSLPR